MTDYINAENSKQTARIYTSLPCRVLETRFTDSGVFLKVKPETLLTLEDGYTLPAPVIENVPVLFPSAGGAVISLPVSVGDTVLCNFTMRTLENWLNGGGKPTSTTPNINHSISNAVAILGLYAKEDTRNPYKGVKDEQVEIRYKGIKIILKDGEVTIESDDKVVVNAQTVELAGDTQSAVLGDTLNTWLAQIKDVFDNHQHTYISAAGTPTPTTMLPTPPTFPTVPDILSDKVKLS